MKDAAGALVAGIRHDSPAAKAGLAARRVIAEVNSPIANAHDLVIRSALKPPPGKMVKLTIRPQGRVETPAAKLERMKRVVTPQPDPDGSTAQVPSPYYGSAIKQGEESFLPDIQIDAL